MAITLTYSGTTVSLSDRLIWVDEFEYSPVVQTRRHSITGALLVETGKSLAGRPITLQGSDSAAWLSRTLCDTLQAWAALPGIQLALMLRGVTRTVMFDHVGGAFVAVPMWRLADGEQTADELLVLKTLRLFDMAA